MNKELELWEFVRQRLRHDKHVMLLVVADSSGSSPGRAGYKMAVDASGELCGSIGGGVMEMKLVDQAKTLLPGASELKGGSAAYIEDLKARAVEQVHRKNAENASGMICSGRQTVIMVRVDPADLAAVELMIDSLTRQRPTSLKISSKKLWVGSGGDNRDLQFSMSSATDFEYEECLGEKDRLYIVGGGHCSLALSEVMSRLGFYVYIFDDRPELNTIEKNRFAREITIIDSYDEVSKHIAPGGSSYVVVMTVGYVSDEKVIRSLAGLELKYLGVLGSRAKMATMLRQFAEEGFPKEYLDQIHTPIGVPINSHTPEEIAISIAAQIISIRNRTDQVSV